MRSYNFTWCEPLSEAETWFGNSEQTDDLPNISSSDTLFCAGDYYAVGSGYDLIDPNGTTEIGSVTINGTWEFSYECEPYSGSNKKKDIKFSKITNETVKFVDENGDMVSKPLSGASITYQGAGD